MVDDISSITINGTGFDPAKMPPNLVKLVKSVTTEVLCMAAGHLDVHTNFHYAKWLGGGHYDEHTNIGTKGEYSLGNPIPQATLTYGLVRV